MPNWIEIRNSIEMTDNSLRINLDETDRHPQRIYIYRYFVDSRTGRGDSIYWGKKRKRKKEKPIARTQFPFKNRWVAQQEKESEYGRWIIANNFQQVIFARFI